ncbi:TetR family transcriptional regulator [Microbacterium barkeri]|uniref:TetR family transcriptional regulator n=1 Tax=Microbacterium barkeri TaxID=33917 RepID=UPI0024AFD9D2|nr:TetR family transcriptional regulator [Microbacterium barkeri]MDI6944464.1 TetR family transcriptional regulator [Microbacterium barkeri]
MAWDVEGTKRKIIEAATDEFVAHGQHGTTIERIAKRAGVNKERVYNYFGGKPELFALVLREKVAEGAVSVPYVATGIDDVGGFESRLVDFNQAHPELIRLLAWEALAYTDAVPDEEKRVERYARRTDEIRVAQEAGALTTSLDADMLHVLLLALAGYGALAPQVVRMITGVGTDDERYRAAVVEAARRLAAP